MRKKITLPPTKVINHEIKADQYFKMREAGEPLDKIRKKLKLSESEFEQFEQTCLDNEAYRMKEQTVGAVFINYLLNQKQCLKDLKDIHKNFKRTEQTTGVIASIKLRSEIHDKILEMGQNLGVIAKSPKRQEINLQMQVQHLGAPEIKQLIVRDIAELEKLVDQYGEQNILDIDVGPIHHQLKSPDKEYPTGHKSKTRKAKTARRVLRGKEQKREYLENK